MALLHRIVDAMVDHYRPEIEELNDRLDELEDEIFAQPESAPRQADPRLQVATSRRCGASCCRSGTRSARLARREFPMISGAMAYRFRDVHDHLVRLVDEAMFFQDRVTSLLDAHLSLVSNQLNGVMKVLTIIATIFMPLTVITGMWGMNVTLPDLPGGQEAQFWWVVGADADARRRNAVVFPEAAVDLKKLLNYER